jgi:STE24 endopeptidase
VAEDSTASRLLTPEDIDGEQQREAKALARLSHRLLALEMALGGCFMLALLGSGLSGAWKRWALAWTSQPVLVVAAYFLLLYVTYTVVTSPLEYYGGFRLPHRYGLSNQTLAGWLTDQLKGGLIGLGLGLVIAEVVYFLLRTMPHLWWLVTAAFMLLFTVVLASLAPVLLVPLFYKLTPLDDEVLAARLEYLAGRAGTSIRDVYTVDLSSRSKAANAMVMGLGSTRRIALGDTLYEDYQPDEIEAIVAHELGHQAGHDVWWGLAVQAALTLVGLYLAHVAMNWGVRVFGFSGPEDVAAMPFLALLMGAFLAVTTPLANAFSRWRERLADDYALEITGNPRAFVSAMVRLANQNLADVDPERWVELLLHSHPALGKRIRRGQSVLRTDTGAVAAEG